MTRCVPCGEPHPLPAMPAPSKLTDDEKRERAARVRTLREKLNLSQDALADALGLSRGSSVSDLERGTTTPTPQTLRLLDYIERFGYPMPETPTTGDSASDADELRTIAANLGAIASRIETRGTDDAT